MRRRQHCEHGESDCDSDRDDNADRDRAVGRADAPDDSAYADSQIAEGAQQCCALTKSGSRLWDIGDTVDYSYAIIRDK